MRLRKRRRSTLAVASIWLDIVLHPSCGRCTRVTRTCYRVLADQYKTCVKIQLTMRATGPAKPIPPNTLPQSITARLRHGQLRCRKIALGRERLSISVACRRAMHNKGGHALDDGLADVTWEVGGPAHGAPKARSTHLRDATTCSYASLPPRGQ